MKRIFESVWAVLLWLFVIMIPIQFYLAGHGAMEGAHAADKNIAGMQTAWDPHVALGTFLLLVSLLCVIAALAARLDRRLIGMTAALFVLMVIQYVLPLLNDSASTRWIAALHAVNAILVTGLAIDLAIRSRSYLPIARFRAGAGEASSPSS